MLFCKASASEWQQIQHILATYEAASGQCINKQKTSILFNTNTRENIKNQIKKATRVTICQNLDTYLGLPLVVGQSKYKTFSSLKERI